VCSGAYRLSKRNIEELIGDFFGVRISLGSIANLEHATSEALKPAVAQAVTALQSRPTVNIDETGWFEKSSNSWLWAAVAEDLTVFLVRKRRGADVAKEILGTDFAGVAITDQWRAYDWLANHRRQLCWAHLIRNFRSLEGHGPVAVRVGAELLTIADRLFAGWHAVRDGTISLATFRETVAPLRSRMSEILYQGRESPIPRLRALCRDLRRSEAAMWTFVDCPGVEPTNNAAERAVRHGVLWRKSSFGTDSQNGSRFVERILTVVATLRQHGRHVLGYVTEACRAALTGRAPPPLLPTS
jgi:transposase